METPKLWTILSESSRIIKSSRHFLGLYVIFLLPQCFLSFIYLAFIHSSPPDLTHITLYNFFLSIFSLIFSNLSIGTITYSTYNVYYRKPVNLLQSIKSLSYSFIPLILTSLTIQALTFVIVFVFILVLLVCFLFTQTLGSQIDYYSSSFIGLVLPLLIVFISLLFYVGVSLALVSVVVVVESKWGFEALRRGVYLVKGSRMLVFWLLLIYIVLIGSIQWGFYLMLGKTFGGLCVWKSLGLVVVGSSILAVFMLYYIAAITVLFIYCKASHGELATKDEEVVGGYISLSLDDEKKVLLGVPVV